MAIREFIDIGVRVVGDDKVKSLNKETKALGRSADDATDSMFDLSRAAQAVAAAISVQQVIAYADAWTVVNNKLANSVRANEQLADVTERVFNIAQGTRTSLDATATLYSRLERATREYNVSADQLAKLTTTINQGFVISGATAEEAENAIIQLAQGLSAGALRGEEFNSVNEQGNRIIIALADSLGKSVGQMKELAAQGKLTTDVVVNGLLKQSDVIENEFTKTIATFAQRTQEASQNLQKFVGESATITTTVAAMGSALVVASESLEDIAEFAAGFATVMIARAVPSIQAAVAATAEKVAANNAAIASENLAAQANLRRAAAEKAVALGLVQSSALDVKATASTNAYAFAKDQLTKAQARAAVAVGAYNAAVVRATAATQAASVATRAFGAATALIGGPVGAALLAAAAIAYFVIESDKAKVSAAEASEEVENLKDSFTGLTRAQREVEISKINTEMAALRLRIKEAREEELKWSQSPAPYATAKVQQYRGEIDDLNDSLNELSVRQQAIFAAGIPQLSGGAESDGDIPPVDARTEAQKNAIAKQIEQERLLTQAMRDENLFRFNDFNNYTALIDAMSSDQYGKRILEIEQKRQAEKFAAEQDYNDTVFNLEQKRLAIQQNEQLTAEDKATFRALLDEQELLALEEKNQRIIESEHSAAQERKKTEEELADYKIEVARKVAQSTISIGQGLMSAFDGQSKKMFEIGKAAAIAGATVDGYFSAVAAWKAGMETGGPWAPAVAAAYTAASLVKTGGLIKSIASTKFGGGVGSVSSSGGGGMPNVGGSGSATAPGSPSAPAVEQTQTRTISIEGLEPGQKVSLSAEELSELLSNNDDVIIAVNQGQQSGRRSGLTG